MRKWVALAGLSVAIMAIGCSSTEPTYAPSTDHCASAAMPEGAVISFSSGSAWAGDRIWSVVAFPDGRLVINEKIDARVSAERVAKLVGDIEATEVRDEAEGCYYSHVDEDSGGATLKIRDAAGGHIWSQAGASEAPDEVVAAISVGNGFVRELLDANIVPKKDNDG